VYADDLDQAIRRLALAPAPGEGAPAEASLPEAPSAPATAGSATTSPKTGDSALAASLRAHLERYRQLTAQGKLSEAGRELEAMQKELHLQQ
jgi:hypothetical protein